MTIDPPPDLETLIRTACVLEATARKPGNVHPDASFVDLTYADFLAAADIVAPILARAAEIGVGRAVLDAVRATQQTLGRNVNLGIILLIAPLAAVPRDVPLATGIGEVLRGITQDETEMVYEAIRLSNPGGMGTVKDQDVTQPPTQSLMKAMQLAAERDQIAAEFTTDFSSILCEAELLANNVTDFFGSWEKQIIRLQIKLLSQQGDSLIARKCGNDVSQEAQQRALHVLDAQDRAAKDYTDELARFDNWLRGDGHRRNPGTTADLIAAILFATLREGFLELPLQDIQTYTATQLAEVLLATDQHE